jgi:hypothetical protein
MGIIEDHNICAGTRTQVPITTDEDQPQFAPP